MINVELNSNWLYYQSKSSPDSPFIIFENKSYSYQDIYLLTRQTAKNFSSKKIHNSDYVFLNVKNNFEYVIALFALWEIGAIPVLVNPHIKPEELIEKTKFFNDFKTIDCYENAAIETSHDLIDTPYSGKAIILFTSGSTGIPKAVEITFNNLFQSSKNTDIVLEMKTDDKWLASLPFHHIGGFSIITRSLLSGSSFIIPNEFSTKNIIENLINKPTFISVVPTMLKRFLDDRIKLWPELKHMLLGGAKCDSDLIRDALQNNFPLIKVYGSSETSSFVTANKLNQSGEFESVGIPIGDNVIEIVSKKNEGTGEIIIKGQSVAEKYLNNDPVLKDKLRNNNFRTGDIGYFDKEGNLHIVSRIDNMIISGGINIYPEEIETELLNIPEIKEAFVFSTENSEWGEQVNAAVALNGPISEEKIKSILKEKIANYKVPKKIHLINSLPKTELGKIDKPELMKLIKPGENSVSEK